MIVEDALFILDCLRIVYEGQIVRISLMRIIILIDLQEFKNVPFT